jgi:hypothetical protein
MAQIGLVACVGKKRPIATRAKDLYDSPLFAKSRTYAERHSDGWYILSAKYGLVHPEKVIEPYEETLNTKPRRERDEWAQKVWGELRHILTPGDCAILLAGSKYRESLMPLMTAHGCEVKVPMEGLGIGQQLQWLKRQTTNTGSIQRP